MLRPSIKLALGAFALFVVDVADLRAQTETTSETAIAEAHTPSYSTGKAYACPSNVPVNERAVRFNGMVTTSNPNGASYQVLIRYGAGGEPAGALEHRDLTTSIASWSVGTSDGETTLELNATVTPSQPLDWAAELWGIDPGNVYHIWQTRSGGTLTRDETCEYQIVGVPDLAVTINRAHPNYVDGDEGRFHVPLDGTFEFSVEIVNNGDDTDTYGFGGSMGPTMTGVPELFQLQSVEPDHGAALECEASQEFASFSCDGQALARDERVGVTVTATTVATGSGAISVGGAAPGEQNFADNNDLVFIEALSSIGFGTIEGTKVGRVPTGPDDYVEYPLDGVWFELRNASDQVVDVTYSAPDFRRTTTDSRSLDGRGTFRFENLPEGTYTVEEVPVAHMPPIDPPQGAIQVVVTGGQTTTVDFINGVELDWGDLPDDDTFGCDVPAYCYATRAPYGASHAITDALYLGGLVPFFGVPDIDAELGGQPTFEADGDDFSGIDDENGVTFDSLGVGGMGQVTVEVTYDASRSVMGAPRLLAWIDFNDDNILSYGERIIDVIAINGLQTITFPIPIGSFIRFARFRLASNPPNGSIIPKSSLPNEQDLEDPASYGHFADGEVEDYDLRLKGLDYGDAPETMDPDRPDIPWGYPTTTINNGARHLTLDLSDFRIGDRVDGEINGAETIEADGDDYANLYDEDGIRFDAGFIPLLLEQEWREVDGIRTTYAFAPGTHVTVTPLANRDGKLDAWFDFNRNGSWEDEGEKVIDDVSVQSGPFYTPITFQVPSIAEPGWTFARFRFSARGGLDYVGAVEGGEVEDYLLRILPFAIPITTLEDAGPGSLRQSIENANATDGTDPQYLVYDTDDVAAKTEAVISLLSPLPTITNPIFISGGGSLVLDGSQAGDDASGLVFGGGSAGVHGLTLRGFARHGIDLSSADNTVSDNVIRDNGGDGVHVGLFEGNRVVTNQISGNGGLGIDIGGDGPTANDNLDADGITNRPTIVSVVRGSTTVSVTLSAAPDSDYLVQFFANEECDDSGSGEGDALFAATIVETDGGGEGAEQVTVESTLPKGKIVTATATGQSGTSEFSECQTVVRTEEPMSEPVPGSFTLGQNYPNPFSTATTIPFDVAEPGHVRIEIFNNLGQVVDVPVNAAYAVGRHHIAMRTTAYPSGVYFYRMTAGSHTQTGKMIVLR